MVILDEKLNKMIQNPSKIDEIYSILNKRRIGIFERFARALARNFTLGNLGKEALRYSSCVHPFLMLNDGDLGNTDYKNIYVKYGI